ncbi:MAG: DUF4114 domain-containing protein [Symploca sp. SIO2C1]|nr:DUF4114 domain-containing protein [Symploca sp. SIO2C1]
MEGLTDPTSGESWLWGEHSLQLPPSYNPFTQPVDNSTYPLGQVLHTAFEELGSTVNQHNFDDWQSSQFWQEGIASNSFSHAVALTGSEESVFPVGNFPHDELLHRVSPHHIDSLGDVFTVPGAPEESVTLSFEWTTRKAAFDSEVGVFVIDEQGRVNGVAPHEAGYALAALSSPTRQILFSSGQGAGASRTLTFQGGSRLGFYIIQDNTAEYWLKHNPNNIPGNGSLAFFSINGVNPDLFDHSHAQTHGDGSWELAWEDLTGGGDQDFDDVVFRVSQVPQVQVSQVEATSLPGQVFQSPGVAGQTVTTNFNWLSRSAAYNNEMGLYLVDDPSGRIGNLLPGDPGYAAAALSSERRQVIFESGERAGATESLELPAQSYFGWYLIQNATTHHFLSQNPENQIGGGPLAFFSFSGGNPDDFEHIQVRSERELAWEDLTGGGDRDFNDLVFSYEFDTPTGTPHQLSQIAINDVTVTEEDDGQGVAEFTISLSQPSNAPIIVDFITGEDTATAGEDFQSISGSVIFAAGETSQSLVVPLLWDRQHEDDEQFFIQLSNPVNAEIVDAQGIGTIEDNDPLPQLAIADVSVVEGDTGTTQMLFTVSLSAASDQPVTVEYTSQDGTAVAGQDYQAVSGTLTFEPGGALSQTIAVLVQGDTVAELDESVILNLSNATNAEIVDTQGIGTIEDDDPLPQLAIADVSVVEGDTGTTQMLFTVSLSAASNQPVTVEYASQDGTAVAGQDYQAVSGTLTFEPGGVLSQTIAVLVQGDTVDELDEAVILNLSNPVNAEIVDTQAVGTIEDDDDNRLIETDIVLQEGSSFQVSYELPIEIPAEPSVLRFTYADLVFDTATLNAINDAFEVALVDEQGNSLVHTLATNQDAFFNVTEGESSAVAAGVTIDGQTVSLNLAGLPPETAGTLILRLVNDDGDSNTSVRITDISLQPTDETSPTDVTPVVAGVATEQAIDFAGLLDVSASTQAEYSRTSLNQASDILLAEVAIRNTGTYSIGSPLLVAVTNISDPTVSVVNADGFTPDGLPYYDFSNLIEQSLDPTELTATKPFSFWNPNGIQFTYDVVVLAGINAAPEIGSTPGLEVIAGQSYLYDVEATDPDNDSLSYELVVAPVGMSIDENTGLITWETTTNDIANHAITVQVSDGRGGTTEQTYTVSVIEEPPNRPPIFTSTPVVDAQINQPYIYDSHAIDPDSDPLEYSLVIGPEGMRVDPETGVVEWTPPPVLALGDTVLGQIGLPGETNEFTLSGVTGQRLYLDNLQSFSGWQVDIFTPSGLEVDRENGLFTLTETGNYRVVVGGSGDQTGSYGFSIIDPNLLPETPFDTVIEGQLSPGSESDLFRFNGLSGQKLFFDQLSKNGNVDWVLLDSGNRIVAENYSMNDLELYLPRNGEYILAVRGKSGFTDIVDYSFEIVTPDEITNPLLLGSNDTPNSISGSISEPGEEDFFTFTGSKGQRLYLDRLNAINNSSITVMIESPSGQEFFSYYDRRRLVPQNFDSGHEWSPITLTEDGIYRVRIDGVGDDVGDYSFSLRDFDLATPIDLDQLYSGTLTPGEASHLYQFEALEGQRLFLDYQDDAGNYPNRTRWVLYDSGNRRVDYAYTGNHIEVVLDHTDTYTLAIEGDKEDIPVNYSFEVITPDTNTSTLAFNTPIIDAITEKGEQDVFIFEGTQGQRIFFDVLQESNHRIDFVTPSGQKLLDSLVANSYELEWYRSPFILPEDGTYQILFDGSDGNTGSYEFQVVDVSNAPILSAETPITNTLTPGNSIDFYQFEGSKGDRIYLDNNTTSQSLFSHVFSPGGQLITRTSNNRFGNNQLDLEFVLPGDGTYFWMLRGEGDEPIDYTIELVSTTAPPAPISLNTTVDNAITKLGEQDAYTFAGNAGQRVIFDALAGNSNITVEIKNPLGDVVFGGNLGSDSYPFTLLETGTYEITIDGNNATTGDYSFALRESALPLTVGTPLTGTLAAQETLLYEFVGSAGEILNFDSLSAASGGEWVLYAPNNRLLESSSLGSDFTHTLPADGTYLLALRNNLNGGLSYDIQLNDISPTPVVSTGLGQLYSGEMSTFGEVDEYTFTANTGTLFYFDGLQDIPNLRARLYNPDGTTLFSSTPVAGDRGLYRLTQTGEYTVRVNGLNTTGSYEFNLVDVEAIASDISFDTVINTSLEPRESAFYKFTGTSGQQTFFDGLDANDLNVTARIFDSTGHQIVSTNTTDNSGLQTLPFDGDYYLLLDSENSDSTTVNWRLLDPSNATPLALDTLISGDFGDSKRETFFYSFTGNEGQKFYFDRTVGGTPTYPRGSNNTYAVYSPDGQQVFSQYLLYDTELASLPKDGQYLLEISGNADANNDYGIQIVTPIDETASINFGEVIAGDILEAGQTNTYTFTGTENQRLIFDSLSQASNYNILSAEIYSPSGKQLIDYDFRYNDPDAFTLHESGTYQVVVDASGTNTSSYSFRLLDFADATEVNLDTPFNGNLGDSKLETDLYRFTGEKDQRVYFDRLEGQAYNTYVLSAPDGHQMFSRWLSEDYYPTILPTDGEYFISFIGNGSSNNSNYSMNLVTPDWLTTEHTIGETISGEIGEAGEVDYYTFTGQPGQVLRFDSLFPSQDISATLRTPSGRQIWNEDVDRDIFSDTIILDETGTYTLSVDAPWDSTGEYAFRFLDFEQAIDADLDQRISGTFGSQGNDSIIYKFDVEAGQRLYFKETASGNSYQGSYSFHDSSGNRLFHNYNLWDLDSSGTVIEKSGEYFLVLSGSNGSNYDFEIVTPEFVSTEYTIGDAVFEEISEAGEQDWYSFDGVAGQQIYLDSLLNANGEITRRIYSPTGKAITRNYSNELSRNSDVITLEETGTYRFTVDASWSNTGEYGFRLLDVGNAETLDFNTPISGDFGDSNLETQLYQFSGEKGEHIFFDRIDGDRNNYYTLYPANGERLFFQSLTRDRDFALPETGNYLLALVGNGSANNTYSLEVIAPDLVTETLQLGQTVNGTINELGQYHTYTFEGEVGQQLFFDILGRDNPLSTNLYSPTGKLVIDEDTEGDWLPFTLTESGTYRLVVDSDGKSSNGNQYYNTGDYSFTLSDRAVAPALELATPLSGTLEPGNSVDLYQFTGTQGTTLNFDLDANQWGGANWILYDPGNQAIATPAWNSPDFEVTLPSDGSYTLAIQGSSGSPVNYSFQVTDTSVDAVENTGFGVVQSGSIDSSGQVDSYTFTANAGTKAFFDSQDSSSSALRFRLVNPDGSYVINNQYVPYDQLPENFQLNQTGEYTLEVYGQNGTGTGNYQFQLLELPEDFSSPTLIPLEIGTVIQGTLDPGRSAQAYSFIGGTGESIYFNGIEGNNVTVRLYAPNGTQVFSVGDVESRDRGPYTLTQDGMYHLVLQGGQDSAANYEFQLLDFDSGQELKFNLPNSGTLESGSQNKLYQFSGEAGQTFFFDSRTNSSSNWKLYDTGNRLIREEQLKDDFEVTLDQDGTYTLMLGGGSNNQLDYDFRVFTYDEKQYLDSIIPGTGEDSSTDAFSLGSFAVKLAVEDGQGGIGFQDYQIRLLPDPENNEPVITSKPETSMGLNQVVYTYQIEGFDLDNDELTYRLVDSPSGAYLKRDTGKLWWLPENPLTVGETYEFTVEVNDRRGGATQQTFTVEVEDNDVRKGFGEISGTVWNDNNSDRQRGITESGAAGVQVYLDLNANGKVDPDEPIEITAIDNPFTPDVDETGQYKFTDLTPGTYIVREVEPDGFLQTFPNEPLRVTNDGILLAGSLSLLQPNPDISATFVGRAGISTDGFGSNLNFNPGGSGTIQADVPTGSTVEYAFLHVATRAFGEADNPEEAFRPDAVGFEGTPIALSWLDNVQDTPPRLNFETGRADVTSIVAEKVGSGGGIFDFQLDEYQDLQSGNEAIEGISLTVIYSNPNLPERTLMVFEGGLTGEAPQSNVVSWGEPLDTTSPDFSSQLALGIQYSEQPRYSVGTQFTTVDINGERLTSSAGNSNDGITIRDRFISVNGALVSVGGVGDSLNNPTDPFDTTNNGDDELYNLVPFINDGDTALRVDTANPSNDDSIFLAALTLPNVAELDSSGFYSVNVSQGEVIANLDFGNGRTAATVQNESPTFISEPPTTITIGNQLRYEAQAVDAVPDNDWLYYDLLVNPEGMAIDPSTGVIYWSPTSEQVGTVDVVLRVQDLYGGRDLQHFRLEVQPPNTAPTFTSDPTEATSPQVGKPFEYNAVAIDADGDPITYELATAAPNGVTLDSTSGVLSWTPTDNQLGNHEIILKATDDKGGESTQTLNLTVIEPQPNTAPSITSLPRNVTRVNTPYLYQLAVEEPDGDPLTFTLINAPAGMTVNQSGLLSWQPTAPQIGSHTVTLTVEDGQGGSDTQSYNLDVRHQAANYAPEITSEPLYLTNIERFYQYQATATDPDGDALFWELTQAPEGMVIDPQTGVVSWQPELSQVGEHTITAQVTDALGAFATQTFTLEARGVNTPPQILSIPPTEIGINQTYRYTTQATDPEGDPLSFSLGAHPEGMTIDETTGEVQWTPTQVGTQEVEVVVRDTQGGVNRQVYAVVVTSAAVNQAPTITSTPTFLADTVDSYQYQLAATDPDGDPLIYSLLVQPSGMSIDENGLLQWLPMTSQLGDHTVTVAAFDSLGLGATQTYTLQVTEVNQAPVISSTPIEAVAAETPYHYDIWASDPDGEPITYTLVNAPAGMAIDELGRITWSPSVTDIGNYPIEVAVTDSRGAVTTQTYNLVVEADQDAPQVNLVVSESQVDVGNSVTLRASATDNVGVEFLTLTVNGTPVALDAQGRATVQLDAVGTIEAVVTATDAAGNSSSTTQSIVVIDPTDTEAPVVELISLEGGTPFTTPITAPTDIIGTVSDDNLLSYTLSVAPLAGGDFVEIASGTNPVTDGFVADFDPSVLQNDTYRLRLSATDAAGLTAYDETLVDVTGELKLGNFQLSFTDLSIPVSGIPIQVTRTYDTLTSSTTDDFGYGWRLEFRDTDLRTSLGKDEELEEFGISSKGFEEGERVYITLPGGKREAFTFKPQIKPISRFFPPIGGADTNLYTPAFESESGSTSTLTVKNVDLIRTETGEFASLNGGLYNPANGLYGFGGYYELTTKEGIVYRIDGLTGDVNTVTDRNNNTLTFTDAGISSSTGQEITFERNATGQITAVIDPEGNRVTYEYDALGDLVAVTDREGNVTHFDYHDERPHYLEEIIDPLGRTGVRSEYDEQGRLVNLFDADGNLVELIHDPDNSIETVKDQFGNTTIYEYDERGNVLTEIDALGGITSRTYDDDNNTLTETDPLGNTTTFTYDDDGDGDVLTETDPLGNVTRYTYDRFGNVLTTTDPTGQTITNTYDTRGNLTQIAGQASGTLTFSYDAFGNLTSMEDGSGTNSFVYDAAGNITSQTDALGNTTTFTYDSNGNRLSETTSQTTPDGVRTLVTEMVYDSEGRVIQTTNAEGGITQTVYDAAGNRIEEIDALGRSTKYIYDERGQLTESIYPDATPDDDSDNPRTRTEYDLAGQVVAEIDELGHRTAFVYDALGRQTQTIYPDDTPDDLLDNPRTRTEYDAAGRVVAEIDERGNRTEFVYDAAGRLIKTILPDDTPGDLSDNPRSSSTYDAAGRQLTQTDPLGQVTRFLYDDLGRPVGQEYADGTTTSVEFDTAGRVVGRTDQAGQTTGFEYDALGRLTAVVDALGHRTEYTYDEQGNLITQTDANGHITRYEYDGLGRRTATELELGQRSSTTYNAVGNALSTTDFNGDTITYEYDERNRLIFKDLPGDEFDVAFTYTDNGLRETVTDGRGTTTYSYDERDRLLQRIDPDGRSIAYTYDEAGNRTSVEIPSGSTAYTFDEQNRLQTVTDPDGGVTTYTYNALGNLIRTDFANGTVEIREYDQLHRLVYLENSGADGVINSFRYTLDETGNRTAVEEHDGRRVEYRYDELYRLTQEAIFDPGATEANRTIEYAYDEVGNRLSREDSEEGVTLYTYDDNDRLLTATTDGVETSYAYDDNGNTVSKATGGESVGYQWNAENRLIAADTDGDGTVDVTNQYDANGIRVSQTVGGEETRFLIDGNRPYAQVVEEYTPGGVIKVSYVHGHDLISQDRDGEQSFYHVDGLGSTRALSDESGVGSDQYIYDAFGQVLTRIGDTDNSYLFAGEQRDTGLGLDYLRARYFDTETGRFYGRDPFKGFLNNPITLNKHLYANANPVINTDPTGLVSINEQVQATGLRSVLSNVSLFFQKSTITNLSQYTDYFIAALNLGTSLLYAKYLGFDTSMSLKFRTREEVYTVGTKISKGGNLEISVNAAPTLSFTQPGRKKSYGGTTLKLVFNPKNNYKFIPEQSRIELPGSFSFKSPLFSIGFEGSIGLGVSRDSYSTIELKLAFEFLTKLGFSIDIVPFDKLGFFDINNINKEIKYL